MADATRTLEVEIQAKGLDALKEIGKSFGTIAKESGKADKALKKVDKTTKKTGKTAKSTQDKLGAMAGMFRDMDGVGGRLGDTLDAVSTVMSGTLGVAIGATVAAIGALTLGVKVAIDAVSAFAETNAEASAKFGQLSSSVSKAEVSLGEVITRTYELDTAASALSVILDATYGKWLKQEAATLKAGNSAERLRDIIASLPGPVGQAALEFVGLGNVANSIAGAFYNAANAAAEMRRQIALNKMRQSEFERTEKALAGDDAAASKRATKKRLAKWEKIRGFTSYDMAYQAGVVNTQAEWNALQGTQYGPAPPPSGKGGGGGGGGGGGKVKPPKEIRFDRPSPAGRKQRDMPSGPSFAGVLAERWAIEIEAMAEYEKGLEEINKLRIELGQAPLLPLFGEDEALAKVDYSAEIAELEKLQVAMDNIDLAGGKAAHQAKKLDEMFLSLGSTIGDTLLDGMTGLAGGIASTMGAFAAHTGTLKDFGDMILDTFGDLAGQLGGFFVKTGAAMLFMPGGVGAGVGLIAGGLALQALGGFLGGKGSGNKGAATGRGGSQAAPAAFTPQDMRRTGEQRTDEINITIEGDTIARAVDNSARRGVMRHVQVRFA